MKKMILALSFCFMIFMIGCGSTLSEQYIKTEEKQSTSYGNTNISPCLQANIVPEKNRVTMAGYIKDGIVSEINKELNDKFGEQKKFDYYETKIKIL